MKKFVLVLLLSVVLFFTFLGQTTVFQVAEARNAECAKEMLENDNWVVPTFNGELRTDKPALEYFGMILAYLMFGVNETAARFFSALCGVLVVLATFWFTRRHWGEKAALWASLVLLSSLHVILQFRLATPDPYLILCHTLSLYLFYEGWVSRKWKWFAGMYVFLGLGILAKGPVGLLLPSLTVGIFLLVTKAFNWKNIVLLKPWWGTFIVLFFSLPWYWAVDVQTGGQWTRGFFLEHNLDRFNNGLQGHGGPFILTVAFILAGMLPFSVFAVRALRAVWKNRKEDRLLVFALVAVGVVAVFYAFSHTKLINYTSPAYPFFAILLGYFISNLIEGRFSNRKLLIEFSIIAVLALGIPVGVYFIAENTPPLETVRWIAWCLVPFPVGAVFAVFYMRQSVQKGLLAVAGTFMVSTLIFFGGPFHIINHQSPIEKYHELVSAHPNVVAYKDFDNAFAFYAQRPIPVFQTEKELEAYLAQHKNVLVLTRDHDLSYMDTIPNIKRVGIDHDLFSRRMTGVYHEIE
ncbi:ArnT family glycosyltransferase [Mangrovibacterium diazotrophicum]|uniref:4-amino-4-deoxy-L-arabinose transferase-like glycosyltransferase n=1 Tax=Mangrovibacterium diazotrophicum TaxID=1261403 RepID=A0A419W7Y2_9BACT|nr:glycosyltransferase family 39 protein [Mangrovibacterium diazotrophicum]RKD91591.1 4-amino-4-deoxy-L-arabinose transferase-like glycosyltransferase [Mangrovibacterium diazotrophicum]